MVGIAKVGFWRQAKKHEAIVRALFFFFLFKRKRDIGRKRTEDRINTRPPLVMKKQTEWFPWAAAGEESADQLRNDAVKMALSTTKPNTAQPCALSVFPFCNRPNAAAAVRREQRGILGFGGNGGGKFV